MQLTALSLALTRVFAARPGATPAYEIAKSLRFRASASARLTRTTASAANRTTFTESFWIKRGAIGVQGQLIAYFAGNVNSQTDFLFNANDTLTFQDYAGSVTCNLTTTRVFRDPSAWYHIVFVYDSNNATTSERARLYVNGARITDLSTATYPGVGVQSQSWQTGQVMTIGAKATNNYLDGYLSEIYFIDGQALDPTPFGKTDPATGVWVPKEFIGVAGGNSFYLPFRDGAFIAELGYDQLGLGNDWTPNNISLTAGATYDWMDDTPTNNFATFSPIDVTGNSASRTFSEGNLRITSNAIDREVYVKNFPLPLAAKIYVEFTASVINSSPTFTDLVGIGSFRQYYQATGKIYKDGALLGTYATYRSGDIISLAVDTTANTVQFFKNGVSQVSFTPSDTLAQNFFYIYLTISDASFTVNFGQRPFAYTPPTGFLPLCTKNLPTPQIEKPTSYFDITLDTGANILATAQGVYTDELVWIKDRANSNNHQLLDSVRGVTVVLQSNTTATETTYTAPSGSSVGWVWKANGTGVSNTAGSIPSTVSANTTAGFSIVTYTGTGANATVGHGLVVAPGVVIVKRRDSDGNWPTQHPAIVAANSLYLNTTAATAAATTVWNSTKPTSTVFGIGTSADVNASAGTYVAYCFAEVEGFSRIGSYTGNGNANGPFVYCGFRPAFVLVKMSSSTGNWTILDNLREGYNVVNDPLYPNLANAEGTTALTDITSNGFKIRSTDASVNTNAGTYIFLAFAETPFKYARGR